MDFDSIFERLKNRIWNPLSDTEAVDMIVDAYMNENIDNEEKEMLLDFV